MAASGLTVNGTVIESLGQRKFKIRLDNDAECVCHISGKLHKHNIKVIVGDRTTVELSPYDLTKGRIIYRLK